MNKEPNPTDKPTPHTPRPRSTHLITQSAATGHDQAKTVIDFAQLPKGSKTEAVQFSDFLGSQACVECHEDEVQRWSSSTHGKAGGLAGPDTIIPEFNGRVLKFSDAQISLKKDGPRYLFEVSSGNLPKTSIQIHGVVGRGLIYGGGAQTYFHRRNDGFMVFIPLEYNVEKKMWFCQTAGPKHWAPIDGSFSLQECGWPPNRTMGSSPGASCQNCHGSQIEVRYSASQSKYVTRFTQLNINCESCHGPGRRHVEIMGRPAAERGEDIGMRPLATLSKRESVLVCIACHANKPHVGTGYLSGLPFHEHFATLTLWDPAERKTQFDGRVVGFGYQQGHLYSDCYLNGSMTCVDCHDPHTNGYRNIHGKPLSGRFNDGQCIGCHQAKLGSHHSRHRPNSEGNRCTSCHMPYHQMAEVGSHFRHERSDHVIPIPRPAFDAALKTTNGCERCHADKGLKWQERKNLELFGTLKPHRPLVQELFSLVRDPKFNLKPKGTKENLKKIENVVDTIDKNSSITALYAISILVGEVLAAQVTRPSNQTMNTLMRLIHGEDLDLRAAAYAALLMFTASDDPERSTLFDGLAKSGRHLTALKRKIIYNLIGIDHAFSGVSKEARARIRRVMKTDGVDIGEQLHEFLPAIGASFYADKDYTQAVDYLQRGIRSKHYQAKAYPVGIIGAQHNVLEILAAVQLAQGQADVAQTTLKTLLKLYPFDNRSRNRLCQLLANDSKWRETVLCLDDALEYEPLFIMGHFIKAEFLERMGRLREALDSLEAGLSALPDNPRARASKERLMNRLGLNSKK